jgi:hypothetical protein
MKQIEKSPVALPRKSWLLLACATALVSACGGGNDSTTSPTPVASAELATGITTVQLGMGNLPGSVAAQIAEPKFHVAPVMLESPADADSVNATASAATAPHTQFVPAGLRNVSSRQLTAQALQAMHAQGTADSAAPMASGGVVATYTPAQIRAAYNLPALPASLSGLTAAQAAQLGAGQTIYLIDAMNDPNVAAELSTFNQKFGLPACTTVAIPASTKLPLAAATGNSCNFSVVYSNASGGLSSTAPAYDSGWATEITLDVQWSHATAPLARIILIEAPDASLNSLLGAVQLANNMGPGIVSMSFGSAEGSWTTSVDSYFSAANMTYLAATGDSGAAVQWPAVSSHVLAVGGTTLTYTGSGLRSEIGWSDTGGGTSAYVATPSYQTSAVPGMGTLAHRTVADVSFNADPTTGQYLAVIPSGSTTVSWLSAGGTSLSTPQWAGVIAVANASRALSGKAALGAPHASLYSQISTVPGNYASAFADITKGSDGSCATCSAKVGYDQLTGLGTPNVTSLLNLLGASTAPTAPVVTPATINGTVGTPLSFTVSATAADALTYSLSGAPSGMSINSSSGAVTWATPVVGTYTVTVKASDSKTGLSGSAVYTVVIAPIPAPVVTSATVSGKAGVALSFTVSATSPDTLTYSMTGAPSGMSIVSSTGVVSWANPVTGTYTLTVTAKDSKTGVSGQGTYTVVIAPIPAPVVASGNVSGKVGTALSFTVSASSVDALTYSLSGAPAGMSINSAGVVSWASPVAGTYSVTVIAKDAKTGLSGQGVYTISISASGPVVTAPAMTGVAGKALTGTISISDPGVSGLSVSISGVPMGMSFSVSGLTITAHWASPITGNYTLLVYVLDSAGHSTQVSVPVTITAH